MAITEQISTATGSHMPGGRAGAGDRLSARAEEDLEDEAGGLGRRQQRAGTSAPFCIRNPYAVCPPTSPLGRF